MSIEYLGLSQISGPLVVLEGVRGAAYDEIVEFTIDGKTCRGILEIGFNANEKRYFNQRNLKEINR